MAKIKIHQEGKGKNTWRKKRYAFQQEEEPDREMRILQEAAFRRSDGKGLRRG
jgi:hypothetical protein